MLERHKWNFVFFKAAEGDYLRLTRDDSKQRSKQKKYANYSGMGGSFTVLGPRCVDAMCVNSQLVAGISTS